MNKIKELLSYLVHPVYPCLNLLDVKAGREFGPAPTMLRADVGVAGRSILPDSVVPDI